MSHLHHIFLWSFIDMEADSDSQEKIIDIRTLYSVERNSCQRLGDTLDYYIDMRLDSYGGNAARATCGSGGVATNPIKRITTSATAFSVRRASRPPAPRFPRLHSHPNALILALNARYIAGGGSRVAPM